MKLISLSLLAILLTVSAVAESNSESGNFLRSNGHAKGLAKNRVGIDDKFASDVTIMGRDAACGYSDPKRLKAPVLYHAVPKGDYNVDFHRFCSPDRLFLEPYERFCKDATASSCPGQAALHNILEELVKKDTYYHTEAACKFQTEFCKDFLFPGDDSTMKGGERTGCFDDTEMIKGLKLPISHSIKKDPGVNTVHIDYKVGEDDKLHYDTATRVFSNFNEWYEYQKSEWNDIPLFARRDSDFDLCKGKSILSCMKDLDTKRCLVVVKTANKQWRTVRVSSNSLVTQEDFGEHGVNNESLDNTCKAANKAAWIKDVCARRDWFYGTEAGKRELIIANNPILQARSYYP